MLVAVHWNSADLREVDSRSIRSVVQEDSQQAQRLTLSTPLRRGILFDDGNGQCSPPAAAQCLQVFATVVMCRQGDHCRSLEEPSCAAAAGRPVPVRSTRIDGDTDPIDAGAGGSKAGSGNNNVSIHKLPLICSRRTTSIHTPHQRRGRLTLTAPSMLGTLHRSCGRSSTHRLVGVCHTV